MAEWPEPGTGSVGTGDEATKPESTEEPCQTLGRARRAPMDSHTHLTPRDLRSRPWSPFDNPAALCDPVPRWSPQACWLQGLDSLHTLFAQCPLPARQPVSSGHGQLQRAAHSCHPWRAGARQPRGPSPGTAPGAGGPPGRPSRGGRHHCGSAGSHHCRKDS